MVFYGRAIHHILVVGGVSAKGMTFEIIIAGADLSLSLIYKPKPHGLLIFLERETGLEPATLSLGS